MTPSIRLLPVLVSISVLALGTKIYDIASGNSLNRDILAFVPNVDISVAHAEGNQPADTKTADKPPNPSEASSKTDQPSAQVASAEAAGSSHAPSAGNQTAKTDDLWVDPEERTPNRAEMRMLQDLTARREALDKREKTLMEREALLNATENQINQKVTELTVLRTEIQDLLKTYDQKQSEKMASLVKIYESMKPPDAARIFDGLDMDILIQVVIRMKEAKTAPILAQMDPARAKELTIQLADRGKLPQSLGNATETNR